MKRRADWAKRLTAFLEAVEGQPFDWAERNCLSVVCDAIVEMTGDDPLADHRARYQDEASAMAIVEEAGGLASFVSQLLGPPLANKKMAGNGDVLVIDLPSGPTAGILAGQAVWCMEEVGLLKVPRSMAIAAGGAAWRV